MKTPTILRLSALLVCLCFTTLAPAQTAPVALPGYWNIETNLTTRDYTIVRFYNGQDQLVYEENLPNLCLDLSRRKARGRRISQQLTVALQQVLRDPATAQPATLLAQQFGPGHRVPRVYAAR